MIRIPDRSNQRGIGILEVLIALVVVSIGVLGLAGTQLNVMRVAKGSNNRSQAVFYAESIIEEMRANPDAVAAMDFNGLDSTTFNCAAAPVPYCSSYPGSSSPTPTCNTSSAKTANSFFSVACGQWTGSEAVNGISDNLPSGTVSVTCDDTPCLANSSYTVNVTWSETEVADGVDVDTAKQVSLRVLP